MRKHIIAACLTLLPALARAQTQQQLKELCDAHKGDFDYLLGDWEFTNLSKQWGKGHGFWSAVRLEDGTILDQYRVTGDKGETYTETISVRSFNTRKGEWELVSLQEGSGVRDLGTAHRAGDEMRIEQTFGASSPHPQIWRIRYHDITADHFLWDADCSSDGGKTWEKECLHIDARRIGPPRSLGTLAPTTKPGR
jgi:hypothetical protein